MYFYHGEKSKLRNTWFQMMLFKSNFINLEKKKIQSIQSPADKKDEEQQMKVLINSDISMVNFCNPIAKLTSAEK